MSSSENIFLDKSWCATADVGPFFSDEDDFIQEGEILEPLPYPDEIVPPILPTRKKKVVNDINVLYTKDVNVKFITPPSVRRRTF